MTTNPETAGVEPVALAEAFLADYHMNLSCWPQDMALRVAAKRVLAPAVCPPAAREDGEVVQKCELYRAAKGLCDNIAEFGTITDGIFVEDLDRAVEAMRENPFCDDIATLGTTQQDRRMEHYARVTLATTRPAPEQAPEPSDDAMWTVVRAGHAWGASTGGEEEADAAAARVIQEYGDRRAAEALAAMPAPAAIRAETTAQIVAALKALENDGGPGLSGYVHNGQLLARLSDHLTGGGE